MILPFAVLKRFYDSLSNTKDAVVKMNENLMQRGVEGQSNVCILEAMAKELYKTLRKSEN